MTTKEIKEFTARFNTTLALDETSIVKNRNRYYHLSKKLKQQAPKDFFYAGSYLGTVKGSGFFPSFLLLSMIAETKANRLVVDEKTAWLFICGRDIFKKGILKDANLKKGSYTLIMNERNECLGFGEIAYNLRGYADEDKIAVKNILDLGDFLRREKRQPKQQHSSKLQSRDPKPRESTKKRF